MEEFNPQVTVKRQVRNYGGSIDVNGPLGRMSEHFNLRVEILGTAEICWDLGHWRFASSQDERELHAVLEEDCSIYRDQDLDDRVREEIRHLVLRRLHEWHDAGRIIPNRGPSSIGSGRQGLVQ